MASPINKVKTIAIPYIHPKVDSDDLQLYGNGKLFSDAQIAAVQNQIDVNFQGRLPKAILNEAFQDEIEDGVLPEFKFSLEKAGNEFFAIYKGKQHSLGSGSFGSVKILQNLTTGETTEALKVLKSDKTSQEDIDQESAGLVKANQFKAGYKRPDKDNQYEIVMQLAKGCSLKDLIGKNLPAVVWIDIMKDVMTAVGDLHARGILHRDIKPDNIHYDLISRKATVIDLGMALFTHDPVRGVIGESVGGTPGFMSPDAEVGTYSEKSELYALGITFAELLDLVVYKSHRIEVFNTEFTVPLVQTVDDPDRENVIKDDNTRLALLTMLQEMTNKNSSLSMRSLPGKTNVVEFLDKVRDEYLDTLGLTNRVAYVNIADLIGDVNEVADMLLAIRQQDIDQIWLIDDNGLYQSEYLDTRHLLTQYGFNISDAVVQYRGDNLEQTMNNYADQREHSDRNIYDARFVTKTGQVVSLKSTIEAEQINKIISSLEEEVQLAIQEDPTQPRIAMIKDAIAAFEKVNQANPVSLVAVLKDLDQLQSNMLHSQESQQNIRFLMTSLQLSAPATPVPAKKTINQQELLKDLDRLKKINPPPAKAVPPPLPPGIVKTPAVPPPLPVGYKKSPAVPPPVPAQYGKVPPPLPPRPAKNAGQPPPLAKPGQAPALDKPPNQGFQRLGLFGGAKDKAPAAVIPDIKKNKIR